MTVVASAMSRMLPFTGVIESALTDLGEPVDPSTWSLITSGSAHLVVDVDGRICVRIAKSPSARANLERRTEVLRRLPEFDFQIPRPLTAVHSHRGFSAVALTWVRGEHRYGTADAAQLRHLLEQLWSADVSDFHGLLDRPGQHWGGHRRRRIILDEVVPRLRPRNRDLARRAISDLAELDVVPGHLVHSDLMCHNMLWSGRRLTGVIDWDHASLGDPAQDVASLALSFGWEALARTLPGDVVHRARLHARIVPMQSVAYTLVQELDAAQVNQAVARADDWIDTRLRALLRR